MNYKLSVIIPVYNVELYLETCINSVLNSTLDNIQIILINDGSTDNSFKICQEYVAKYKNILLINQYNQGLSQARNTGLKEAQGEFIAFLDSDDYVDRDFYKKLYDAAIENNTDIAVGNVICFDESGCEYSWGYNSLNFYNSNKIVKTIDEKQWIMYACACWNKIYKREMFIDNFLEFPKGLYIEDVPITFITAALANKIVLVDTANLYYRQRSSSIMSDARNDRKTFDIFKIYDYTKYLIDNLKHKFDRATYKKIMYIFDRFKIYNLYVWFTATNEKFKDEYYCKLRNEYKRIDITNNQYVEVDLKRKYKIILKHKFIDDIPLESKVYKVFGFIKIMQIDKLKNKTIYQLLGIKIDPQSIFSAKNIDIRKVITIFGIKFKFKSQKLIEKRRWQDLQSSINYVNQQLQEHAQKYNEVIEKLNNKLDEQAQKYNNDITVLHNKLDLQVQKLNNIKQVVDFNRDEIKNNFDITCELLVSSLSQGENNNG